MSTEIELRKLPAMKLAGITNTGFENVAGSYERLVKWAAPAGLLKGPEVKMITVYHDSAKTTAADQVRISACLLLQDQVEVQGAISLMSLNPGICIVAAMEIHLNQFEQAWKGLYAWMNENGHKISAEKPFEIYHNNYQEHPDKKCVVDLCIPILG
jgi:AraC family transcriptional regulator